ncbi:MAG: urease accessory protein [Deltaproteobacteria bacterium]|nr:urease accessory protein [Deltaproteobacteria bacterium]
MISILLLGLAIGMQHAFEADHLAAVSTLVSRERSLKDMARHGAIWGLGHTIALVLLSGVVLFSPWELPGSFEGALEAVVGLLLIALGARLLYRLWRDRVHIHAHRHPGTAGVGEVHLHAHSHRNDAQPHSASSHDHQHRGWNWRTLLVGLTHGAAGSAALTVYVAASLESSFVGIVYVLLFGIGSILGMALLSAVIALPLTATARGLTWAHRGLQVLIGCVSVAIGLRLVISHGSNLWF